VRALWHKRRDREGLFYRCAQCGYDRSEIAAVGVYLRLGNELLGILCADTCQTSLRDKLRPVLPYAFPELDAEGYAIDGHRVGSVEPAGGGA
jgi:hypothetical protein